MNQQATVNTAVNPIHLANALNWGIYRTTQSAELVQSLCRADTERKKAVSALMEDLPVDPADELVYPADIKLPDGRTPSLVLFGTRMIGPVPRKDLEEKPAEAKAEEGAAPVAAAKPTVVTPPKADVTAARRETESLLANLTGKANAEPKEELNKAHEAIYQILRFQQEMMGDKCRGLTREQQTQLKNEGVPGSLMATEVRKTYAEALDMAYLDSNLEALKKLKADIDAKYPVPVK